MEEMPTHDQNIKKLPTGGGMAGESGPWLLDRLADCGKQTQNECKCNIAKNT